MEKRLCVIAAACLAAVSCTTKGENEPQPSLEVSPTSLIFAAAAAPVQEVTVTAVGTDWEYERSAYRIIRRPNSVPPP